MPGWSLWFGCVVWLAAVSADAARPVAQWDVVPDQRAAEVFPMGVCAFHASGVTVEFRVDGRLAHTASEPTLNPRTGVWEFVYPFDPAQHSDGPVTVRARAVPIEAGHASYDLPPMTVYANAGGTLTVDRRVWVDAANGSDDDAGDEASPYQTLAAAVRAAPVGGTILLRPGRYSADRLRGGSDRGLWTTIRPAPGVSRDRVMLSGGRPGTQRLKLQDLTLFTDFEGGYHPILSGEGGRHMIWLDGVKVTNLRGRWAGSVRAFGNRYTAYVTGGESAEIANGPAAALIRGHRLHRITSDAWTGGNKLVVNCSVTDINPGQTGAHPDFHQSHSKPPAWTENVILYNVRGYDCLSQGLFGSRLRHAAFVNVLFEKADTVMFSQYSGPMENVLFLHLNIVRQGWLWRGTGPNAYAPQDVVVINSLFDRMRVIHDARTDGLTLDHNHFVHPKQVMGSAVTTGPAGYVDPAAKDYRIAEGSPAWGTGRPLQCVPADINGVPYAASRNRGCYTRSAAAP